MLQQLFDLSQFHDHGLLSSSELPWEWLQGLEQYLRSLGSRRPANGIHHFVDLDEANGPIHIEDGVEVKFGAAIEGPVFIGAGTIIGRHAAVSSSLIFGNPARRSVIGHCSEVKRSIFLPGARAPHLTHVADSVLGHNVNLGASTQVGNLPLDEEPDQGVRLLWGDQPVDSQMRKFGALIGDGTKIGCGCNLNPGTVLGMSCRVFGQATLSGTFGSHRRLRPDVKLKDTPQRPRT